MEMREEKKALSWGTTFWRGRGRERALLRWSVFCGSRAGSKGRAALKRVGDRKVLYNQQETFSFDGGPPPNH